jgi:hypothetical protein
MENPYRFRKGRSRMTRPPSSKVDTAAKNLLQELGFAPVTAV